MVCLTLCCGAGRALSFQNNPDYFNSAFSHGDWSNSGDIRIVGPVRCVISTDGRNAASGNTTVYTVTASMTTADGLFQLARTDGGSTIPFTLEYEWFDATRSTHETLDYNLPSAAHTGGKTIDGIPCNINGQQVNNGRIILHIDEADLSAAQNGDYEGNLTVVHTGGAGLTETRTRRNLRISLSKNATEIQLRKLDTVDLGTWNLAQGFLDDTESYCVYSSNGSYRITASSATEGSAGPGSFAIEHAGAAGERIDYTLYVDDDGDASSGGVQIDNGETIGGMVATTNRACPGTNASIYAVTTDNLGRSRAGAYSALVTLTVEPE